ncbi:unnamed protein product [Adineta steineri]|uniref:Calcineurin-like phosphoesterase domain-containing protein n=1 Tax=Adineta steineri TaxID=433720 RepID=A0A819VM24_9BILA|nr:unnamed protein product [Adineta steineri]CAF4110763.1 unnamed protein product [Adineta steineri]
MLGHGNRQNSMSMPKSSYTVDNVNVASSNTSSDAAATRQSEMESDSVSTGSNSGHYHNIADGNSRGETISLENDFIKIVCISDTHNGHNNDEFDTKIRRMHGDILIHAGDFGEQGTREEAKNIVKWLRSLENFKYKVFISGNMDGSDLDILSRNSAVQGSQVTPLNDHNVIYLENSSCEVLGINIYGCPYTPRFFGNFQYDRRSTAARKLWNNIPENCDILVSHGPPYGILDTNSRGRRSKQ